MLLFSSQLKKRERERERERTLVDFSNHIAWPHGAGAQGCDESLKLCIWLSASVGIIWSTSWLLAVDIKKERGKKVLQIDRQTDT